MNNQDPALTFCQYYLSGLVGFLIVEMIASWGRSDTWQLRAVR
jgi:hypothetical protein